LRAIDIARIQGAKSLELRASVSLARLWSRQGKLNDAQRLLRAVYDGFIEGSATADLAGARALLELRVDEPIDGLGH
jgi:predicted ATPase